MTYEYKVEQFYNVDGKRDGWSVTEVKAGSFHEYCIDIYPTKAQANKVAKQHADTANTAPSYRNQEMVNACPLPITSMKTLKIQLSTDKGKTKWLNLTPTEYRLIELVLAGIITDDNT